MIGHLQEILKFYWLELLLSLIPCGPIQKRFRKNYALYVLYLRPMFGVNENKEKRGNSCDLMQLAQTSIRYLDKKETILIAGIDRKSL